MAEAMIEVVIGGSAEDDAAAFLATVEAAERGEAVAVRRVLAFESRAMWRRHGTAELATLAAEAETAAQ